MAKEDASPNHNPDSIPKHIPCIACREPIIEGARICRYCHTHQKQLPWESLSLTVKWIGGVVTVISLVIGMFTLTGFYEDWQERRDTVNELVDAADWLIKTRNYRQAWQMYEDALELNPSSTKTYQGMQHLGKMWLRHFSADKTDAGKIRADQILNRITSILYRDLQHSSPDEVATTLAHIGFAQVIRARSKMPVWMDVDDVFQQAIEYQPDNLYANTMLAYWILLGRGIGEEEVTRAQSHFATALENPLAAGLSKERAFVRELQFSSLVDLSYGRADELERASLRILLRASTEMMIAKEPKPIKDDRYKILAAYGTTGRADYVEESLGFLPPEEHLAVHQWLMEGLEYGLGSERKLSQARYLRARLTEELGDKEKALSEFQALLAAASRKTSTPPLDKLVNESIARLTGQLPARATARSYIKDPVDTKAPWAFHLDTLANFDPKWQPRNADQALAYFNQAIIDTHEQLPAHSKLPALATELANTLEKIRTLVREGNEIERLNYYTMGFSASHHQSLRYNLIRFTALYGRLLTATGQLDKAVAELTDINNLTAKLDDYWASDKAWMAFELARAYALRAATKSTASNMNTDPANAIQWLTRAIEGDAVNGKITTWEEIKGPTFASLKGEPDYQALILGR